VLIVQDVCVIERADGARLRHHDVVVVGDRVLAVQTTGGTFAEGAEIVDGRRMFLLAAGLQQRLVTRLRRAGVWIWSGGELLDAERGAETVEPGVRADLVLLGGDPLEDVRNVAQLHGIVTHGTWHERAALERRRPSALPPRRHVAVGVR
jgi:hypothetical protein